MEYNVQDHGDSLERIASGFIRSQFPYYEKVWSIYIGNCGNEVIARLPNYPNEQKRKHFAENSYTVLESFFMLQQILESEIFLEPIDDFNKYIEANKAFITFFALLGRIHDTSIKASNQLGYDNSDFRASLKKFYEARSIVIHGKKVPLVFDELGLLKIPFLKTSIIKGNGWDDNNYHWGDIANMQTDFVEQKLKDFFDQLLILVNNEYANFFSLICAELKELRTSLIFEHTSPASKTLEARISGSTLQEPCDVYGFKNRSPNTNS